MPFSAWMFMSKCNICVIKLNYVSDIINENDVIESVFYHIASVICRIS